MKPFKPRKLAEARRGVVREHPDSVDDFGSDGDFASTKLSDRILKKLRQYDGTNAANVAANLTPVERQHLPRLLGSDLEERVREALLACMQELAQSIPFENAWVLMNEHFRDPVGRFAAINAEIDGDYGLQQELLERYRSESPERVLEQLLEFTRQNQWSGDELESRLNLVQGSELSEAFETSLLLQGSKEVIRCQSGEYLVKIFERASLSDQMNGLAHIWGEFRDLEVGALVQDEPLSELFRHFAEKHESLLDRLERVSSAAADWVRSAIQLLEIDEFFERAEANERYRFWRTYAEDFENIEADLDNERLFIDFGDFGVVEFGGMGATYIYDREYFERMLEKARDDRSRSDVGFKSKIECIERLTHRGSWQEKFRGVLKRLIAD